MPFAWINNQFVDEESASVSIRDTGYLHAAGIFTTMRAAAGKILLMDAHLHRLRNSGEALSLSIPYSDDDLQNAAQELLSRNSLADARLRLTVTRSAPRREVVQRPADNATVLITAGPYEPYPSEWYERGMTVVLLDDQKLNPYDIQAGHKTLNYFSRLAGLRDATQRAAGEALWFNVHNYLQSASVANVFIVKDDALVTPPTNDELLDADVGRRSPYPRSNVLPGITRATILKLATQAGISVQVQAIDVHTLLDADEIFLTNSVMSVMPVCRIEKKVIGSDRPGIITQRLAEAYRHEIA